MGPKEVENIRKMKTPEEPEKTQEKPAKAKKANPQKGVPTYFTAILVILALLAGIAIAIVVLPKGNQPITPDLNTINDANYRTVELTIIYSSDCKNCRNTTTVEELFNIRGIDYTIRKIDIKTEEGMSLYNKFEPDYLPAGIVDANKMKFYPKTAADFENDTSIKRIFGYFVAPELNWAKDNYYPIFFAEKVQPFCNSNNGKPTVVHFNDYYTEETTKTRRAFYNFLADYNESISMKYSYVETVSQEDVNAQLGNVFLSCTSDQGKYLDTENKMTGIYCNNPFKGDETNLTGPEIDGCWTLSNHYGTPLTQVELDQALNRTESDLDLFIACFEIKDKVLKDASFQAHDLGLTRKGTYTRSNIFLIDCQETTNLALVEDTLCKRHPEIESCKE